MKLNRFLIVCFGAALSITSSAAVTPAIGVVSAGGSFEVNSSLVNGNANLFDGSRIKTLDASSEILLHTGAALTLATDSAGTVYKDHLLLSQGTTKADNLNGYSIHAAGYKIEGGQPGSQAVVRFGDGSLQVASLSGSLNVFDEKGALLTRIAPGTASAFRLGDPGGQSGASVGSGNAKRKLGLYLILGGALAGLGVATDAILQPTSP
jgi:hypothetical protein